MLPPKSPPPMKPSLVLSALLSLVSAGLWAETLPADAAVFAAADPQSAVIARLKAGTAITPAAGESPVGWRRIEVAGPFDGFVRNRDITKGLEVREGASIHLAPNATAPVLAIAAAGDKTEVTGLAGGDWCQIKLDKKLVGFVATGETANRPSTAAAAPAAPSASTNPPPAAAPGDATAPGRPVPIPGNAADLPRPFQGTLVAAARPIINPNPPYDYQLVDAGGKRFTYVDLRRVTLNARMETLLNRPVTVIGTLRSTVDGKDLVVAAESIQPR